jgi:hypothetical protein
VSNEHVLSKADVQHLNGVCPRNVFFIRRKSSWVHAALLVEIIQLAAKLLNDVMRTHRVILHMDAHRAHLHVSVMRACTNVGLFLIDIPASTTAWLQPLDTCVFGGYKRWVRQAVEQQRLASPTGCLSRSEVMEVYSRGVGAVMEARSWQHAFESTGLRGQERLSGQLSLRLGWGVPQMIPSSLPSLSDLQAVFPARSDIPIEELFRLLERYARPSLLRLPSRARLPLPFAAIP